MKLRFVIYFLLMLLAPIYLGFLDLFWQWIGWVWEARGFAMIGEICLLFLIGAMTYNKIDY